MNKEMCGHMHLPVSQMWAVITLESTSICLVLKSVPMLQLGSLYVKPRKRSVLSGDPARITIVEEGD